MALNSRIESLLKRIGANANRFQERTDEVIDRAQQTEDTEFLAEQLRRAQRDRVSSPDAGLALLQPLAAVSPGAAIGAGVLANDVDFASFVNKRIEDAKINLDAGFQERSEDRLDNTLISDILSRQVNASNLEPTTGIQAVNSQLTRDNALAQIAARGAEQRQSQLQAGNIQLNLEEVRANRPNAGKPLTATQINTNNSAIISTLDNLKTSISANDNAGIDTSIESLSVVLNGLADVPTASLFAPNKEGRSLVNTVDELVKGIIKQRQSLIDKSNESSLFELGSTREKRKMDALGEIQDQQRALGLLNNAIINSALSSEAQDLLLSRLDRAFED